jgi:hypothetical protein
MIASKAAWLSEQYCSKLSVAGREIASDSTRSSLKHSEDSVLLAARLRNEQSALN